MKILVIENGAEIHNELSDYFNLYLADYEYASVISGTQCLVDIATNNCDPDLIIITINPINICKSIYLVEQIRDYSDIPIVILSHDDNIKTLVTFFEAGVNEFIPFPLNGNLFAARLKAIMRRRKWDMKKKMTSESIAYSQRPFE